MIENIKMIRHIFNMLFYKKKSEYATVKEELILFIKKLNNNSLDEYRSRGIKTTGNKLSFYYRKENDSGYCYSMVCFRTNTERVMTLTLHNNGFCYVHISKGCAGKIFEVDDNLLNNIMTFIFTEEYRNEKLEKLLK